jgi:hypothetical protein
MRTNVPDATPVLSIDGLEAIGKSKGPRDET